MAGSKSVPYCDEVYKLAKALSAAIERGARLEERVHELEKQLKFNSANYPEGFRWDIDDYPAQQTRRWNPETRELEPGQDPPFVAPPAVPFEETDNAA